MKVGLAQCDFSVGAVGANLKKILAYYAEAQKASFDLVVFPELALSGYPPEDLLLRDDFLLSVNAALEILVQAVGETPMVLGCPLKREGRLYNMALVLQNKKILASYAKSILPNYGVFDERRYFEEGKEAVVVELSGKKIGLLVCEDTWFVEPAVRAKEAGAELLLSIHASPYAYNKEERRVEAYGLACRAAGLPMLACMLVGAQDDLCFDGGSRYLDATGQVLSQAPFFEEILWSVDLAQTSQPVSAVMTVLSSFPFPFPLSHLYQALVLGLRDYVRKNHFQDVVLGLSGGIDSALTLMLAIDALGVEHVTALVLPSRYTSTLSMEALREQVALTGVSAVTMSIEPLFEAGLETLAPVFAGLPQDKTEENLQARCRGILLMAYSNKMGKMLLTTGNKSEMAMGYTTLYGDMAGGFTALKDVYKTLVFELARYRNTLGHCIPEVIITRPPTAELAPDQKDQDSLPPYEVLDAILYRTIEKQESIEEIVAQGFDEKLVQRVVKAVYQNEYKRRQSPPGIKVSEISFTRERRYPISQG